MKSWMLFHLSCVICIFSMGIVLSNAGIRNSGKNHLLDRMLKDYSIARRNHKHLEGSELNAEIDVITEYLSNMISLCNKTYNIPLYKLINLEEKGAIPDDNDSNTKCYLYCMLNMMGVTGLYKDTYDTDQTIIMMAEHLNDKEKDVFRHMAEGCGRGIVESNPCDGAYKYFKCIVAGLKAAGLPTYDTRATTIQ